MDDLLDREILGEPVTVKLGSETYTLAYPISALILYKQKTGDNLFQTENWYKISPQEDLERFLACLWAGLQTKHPDLTYERVGQLVNFANANVLVVAISRAFSAYFPKAKEASPNAGTLDEARVM